MEAEAEAEGSLGRLRTRGVAKKAWMASCPMMLLIEVKEPVRKDSLERDVRSAMPSNEYFLLTG
jgi:hypothetical protein